MNDNVQQRVFRVISEVLNRKENEIQLTLSLRDELKMDSLGQMTLFIALEDEFQQSIPPEEAEGLVTVQDVIKFIERKTQEPSLV
ncbi:MAG: acyl carrier protein [Pseudomonadota bacterium]